MGSPSFGSGLAATLSGAAGQMQATAQKENTQLESHLYDLRSLQEELAGAMNRAQHLADRLMGGEPTPLQGNGQNNLKETVEPPLLTKIAEAHQLTKELAKQIHYQLNRLERL